MTREQDDQERANRTAGKWLKARDIIAQALSEITPYIPRETHEQNAEAIIARLAQAEPPMILVHPEEVKE